MKCTKCDMTVSESPLFSVYNPKTKEREEWCRWCVATELEPHDGQYIRGG